MKIVYADQETGSVWVLTPCADGRTIKEIADKDVPAGVPYWIVEDGAIPADRTHRELWEIDADTAGHPDGYGEESNEFHEVANDQN